MRDPLRSQQIGLPNPTRDVSFARTWAGIGRELGTGSPNARLALMRSEVGLMIAAAESDGDFAAATILAWVTREPCARMN